MRRPLSIPGSNKSTCNFEYLCRVEERVRAASHDSDSARSHFKHGHARVHCTIDSTRLVDNGSVFSAKSAAGDETSEAA